MHVIAILQYALTGVIDFIEYIRNGQSALKYGLPDSLQNNKAEDIFQVGVLIATLSVL